MISIRQFQGPGEPFTGPTRLDIIVPHPLQPGRLPIYRIVASLDLQTRAWTIRPVPARELVAGLTAVVVSEVAALARRRE